MRESEGAGNHPVFKSFATPERRASARMHKGRSGKSIAAHVPFVPTDVGTGHALLPGR
jgi:hypothetical protein